MTARRILLTDGLADTGKAILTSQNIAFDDKKGIDADALLKCIADYDALIVRGRTKVTPEVFAKANKLKVIGRCGVGVDNINLDAAKEKGVIVVNAPVSTTIAVAELTMALMLAMLREIVKADAKMKADIWCKNEVKGSELHGKTLGIIGFGHIGSTVGIYAKAFGMKVIVYDHNPVTSETQTEKHDNKAVSFDELLQKADIITIHVPLTDCTRHMINAQTIAKMKDGVRIISTARGGVIDEEALLQALESGKVTSVALDVFEKEPPANSPLVKHPKLIATPHIGGETKEAQQRASADIVNEVVAALNGEPLHWRVA
ncbi:MAG TPA: hydroxyacid dehydrogenase [Anaerolineaceae bacterium]|nr:hydroxyacid dehydrogenase [Anaerolineaceae bacterium]